MRVLIVTSTPDRASHFQKRYAEVFNNSRPTKSIDNVQVVGWGQSIVGYRADLVIIADRGSHWTPVQHEHYQRWFDDSLRCRLLPQGMIMDFS